MDTALHTDLPPTSLSLVIHRDLRAQLLAGEFPIGERLVESRLAERLLVSRTPVREALARLHSEGLVARHPDGGFRPVLPDLDNVAELYRVRLGLELQAIGWPAEVAACEGAHDLASLADLRARWVAMSHNLPPADPEFVHLDEDFHVTLARAAGNGPLVELLQWVNERIRVVRIHDFLTADRIEATVNEHLSVLEAVIGGDRPTAGTRLRGHLRDSLDSVRDRAEVAIGRMLLAQHGARGSRQ